MVGSRSDRPGSFRAIGVAFHSLVGLYACDRRIGIMLAVSERVLVAILLNFPLDEESVGIAFKLMTSTYTSFIIGTDRNGVDILLYTLERNVTPSTDVFDSIETVTKGRFGVFFSHDSGWTAVIGKRILRWDSKFSKFICNPEPGPTTKHNNPK
jgi:hypothetical protein